MLGVPLMQQNGAVFINDVISVPFTSTFTGLRGGLTFPGRQFTRITTRAGSVTRLTKAVYPMEILNFTFTECELAQCPVDWGEWSHLCTPGTIYSRVCSKLFLVGTEEF